MANQDILYALWKKEKMKLENVTLEEIKVFASNRKRYLNARSGRLSASGFDYAILKFILEYTTPRDWPHGVWDLFVKAKHPYKGNYGIWKRFLNLRVDILNKEIEEDYLLLSGNNEESLQRTEELTRETGQSFTQPLATQEYRTSSY